MIVAGTTSAASQLTKIGKKQSAGCQLCRRVREARNDITDSLEERGNWSHGHRDRIEFKLF